MKIQRATIQDLEGIKRFTDFWLAGRGLKVNAPGAVNDCFISPSQHKKYIKKYKTWIVRFGSVIIAWAVIQHDDSLIHFLISGVHRHHGVGTWFLKFLSPTKIHSKSDQSSGNPAAFYEQNGYEKVDTVRSKSRLDIDKIRPNRKKNIDIYQRIA